MRNCFAGTLMLALLAAATSSYAQEAVKTEQAIAKLEGRWLKAQKGSNPDLLAPLLADGFVNTSTDGKVTNKKDTLALVRASKFETAEYTNVKVTVYGSTAIATGIFSGKGTDSSGKAIIEKEQWTDTWVNMPNGKWQCVASHASPIKP
jgi:ketosteroid isomerase-like protein